MLERAEVTDPASSSVETAGAIEVESIERSAGATTPLARVPATRLASVREATEPEATALERAAQLARSFGAEYGELMASMPERDEVPVPQGALEDPQPSTAQEVVDDRSGGPLWFWCGTHESGKTRVGVWRGFRRGRVREVRDYSLGAGRHAIFEFDESGELVRYVPRATANGEPEGPEWRWYGNGTPLSGMRWLSGQVTGPAIHFARSGAIDPDLSKIYRDSSLKTSR